MERSKAEKSHPNQALRKSRHPQPTPPCTTECVRRSARRGRRCHTVDVYRYETGEAHFRLEGSSGAVDAAHGVDVSPCRQPKRSDKPGTTYNMPRCVFKNTAIVWLVMIPVLRMVVFGKTILYGTVLCINSCTKIVEMQTRCQKIKLHVTYNRLSIQ